MIATPPGQLSLFDAAEAIVVRHSVRARRLGLRVFPHGVVEVVVPPRTGQRSIRDFVAANAAWIARVRSQFLLLQGETGGRPPASIRLAAVDEVWDVRYVPGSARLRATPGTAGGILLLQGPVDPNWQLGRLRRWLMDRARAALLPWIAAVAEECRLPYGAAVVRRQRSRWGSCSAARVISLNCALLFLEPALVRYLFVHELAHTRHMHHGPAFWRRVAALEPQYESLEARLGRAWSSVPAWVSYDPPTSAGSAATASARAGRTVPAGPRRT